MAPAYIQCAFLPYNLSFSHSLSLSTTHRFFRLSILCSSVPASFSHIFHSSRKLWKQLEWWKNFSIFCQKSNDQKATWKFQGNWLRRASIPENVGMSYLSYFHWKWFKDLASKSLIFAYKIERPLPIFFSDLVCHGKWAMFVQKKMARRAQKIWKHGQSLAFIEAVLLLQTKGLSELPFLALRQATPAITICKDKPLCKEDVGYGGRYDSCIISDLCEWLLDDGISRKSNVVYVL